MAQLAREHLQAGQIGQVRWVDVTVTLPAPSGGRKWDWWADETQGGGVVGAVGSHVIDLLRYKVHQELNAAVLAQLQFACSIYSSKQFLYGVPFATYFVAQDKSSAALTFL